jgi:hypothetical protein
MKFEEKPEALASGFRLFSRGFDFGLNLLRL